jgi:50S ribosomal subunit-associated GTPase HflX
MMYACSILYKTRLPMVIAFNKVDVVPCDFAMNWMTDSDAFQETLQAEQSDSYMSSLTHSMAMVMDEFYSTLNAVGVSAVTGQGCDELFSAIDAAGEEFEKECAHHSKPLRAAWSRSAQGHAHMRLVTAAVTSQPWTRESQRGLPSVQRLPRGKPRHFGGTCQMAISIATRLHPKK